ncbi:hypothetical protein [Burkholderia sp. RS02]|uniref:hypothetical protein n=1 Tax=unclassified Burkholderia TaxID=2613784 RepID=UPI0032183BFF
MSAKIHNGVFDLAAQIVRFDGNFDKKITGDVCLPTISATIVLTKRFCARCEMVQRDGLVVGEFYWVIQAPGALDQRVEWQSAPQPARLAGITAQGELMWNTSLAVA